MSSRGRQPQAKTSPGHDRSAGSRAFTGRVSGYYSRCSRHMLLRVDLLPTSFAARVLARSRAGEEGHLERSRWSRTPDDLGRALNQPLLGGNPLAGDSRIRKTVESFTVSRCRDFRALRREDHDYSATGNLDHASVRDLIATGSGRWPGRGSAAGRPSDRGAAGHQRTKE